MNGYTKLFGSIVDSTIWRESKETKIVWITLLAKASRDGIVEASLPGLADAARVTMEECQSALKCLMSPDQWSRTKEHEGRRIEETEGGWKILNHAKYRAKLSKDSRREYLTEKQREYRALGKIQTLRDKIQEQVENDPITKADKKQLSKISKTPPKSVREYDQDYPIE